MLDQHTHTRTHSCRRTYEGLEQAALEDVDDSLDGETELPFLSALQPGPVLLQQHQSSLCIWETAGGDNESHHIT